jgi:hypothetical protein
MSWDIIEYIINIWKEEFKRSRKIDYYTGGKDNKAVGLLLAKFKKKYPDKNTEEMVEMMRSYFRDCLEVQEDWYKKNMSLPLINSKVNEINQQVAELRRVRRVVNDANETKKDIDAVGKLFGDEIKQVAEVWNPKEQKKKKNVRLTKVQFIQQYGHDYLPKWPKYKENME